MIGIERMSCVATKRNMLARLKNRRSCVDQLKDDDVNLATRD